MRKIIVVVAAVVLVILVAACDPSLWPQDAVQRALSFVSDASTTPQDLDELRSHFDSVNTAQYVSMLDPLYWDASFFNEIDSPFTLTGAANMGSDATYEANAVRVEGSIANNIQSYPVEFHMVPDLNIEGNFLIRAIIVDPAGINDIIENRM